MPTLNWLRNEFSYGYDSGNVLSLFPNKVRRIEEKIIGGSYRKMFEKGAKPFFKRDSKILELGPGKGAWTRAFLKFLTQGELHTIDFQDVTQWLKPEQYQGRLKCFQISGFEYAALPDNYYDFFWSIGVLCHNNSEDIKKILAGIYPKMKKGAYSVHHYGNWEKLASYGWTLEKSNVPTEFKDKPDDEIWWPRNDSKKMSTLAAAAGWEVLNPDLDVFKRDSVILLRK